MSHLRNAAYQIAVLWVRDIMDVTPTAWQETFCAHHADHPFWY